MTNTPQEALLQYRERRLSFDCLCALRRQTSGNDVFYRNPYNVEENLFVNISSPSSSKVMARTSMLRVLLLQASVAISKAPYGPA